MFYALVIDEYGGDFSFWIQEENTLCSYTDEDDKQKRHFARCLEDYLQAGDNKVGLPSEAAPWVFVEGSSEEEIKAGNHKVIVKLHKGDKDSLWELYQWASSNCTMFRIEIDY